MASPTPIKTATRIVRRDGSSAARRIEADICVVGAGIAGISAALEAARLGRKVTLVDGLHALGGQAVEDFRGFRALLHRHEIGDTTTICGLRDAVPFTTEITFGDAFAAQTASGKEPAQTAALAGGAGG